MACAAEIAPVLGRVLARSPIAEIANVAGLSRAIAASFIGLELYEGVDPSGSTAALDALERLAVLADVVTDLGQWLEWRCANVLSRVRTS